MRKYKKYEMAMSIGSFNMLFFFSCCIIFLSLDLVDFVALDFLQRRYLSVCVVVITQRETNSDSR